MTKPSMKPKILIIKFSTKMYYVKKRIEISAAHRLELDYESRCAELHGHNWIVEVYCRAEQLNSNGMVVDFTEIKRLVKDPLDHKVLNDVLPFNPTAENIARWICERVPKCYRVVIQESNGNTAEYSIEHRPLC